MDAEKHIRDKEWLNSALNGKRDKFSDGVKKLLEENNLDTSPNLALEAFIYVLEEMHLENFNPQKYVR